MNKTIIGFDFGDTVSIPCFVEDFNYETKVGGDVHRLLPHTDEHGIPSVYFYSKSRGELFGYDATSSHAIPRENRIKGLKKQMGQTVSLDGKSVNIDDVITRFIEYCVRIANKQLLSDFRTTTNLISISYPAFYTAEQRRKLTELAEKATLEDGTRVKVDGTIAAPAAAALAYLSENGKTEKDATVLVYDLGGTFNATLVAAYPKGKMGAGGDKYYYDIVAYRSLNDVGGADFDRLMLNLLKAKVKALLGEEKLTKREQSSLKETEAEKAKIDLSAYDITYPEIVHDDEALEIEVTREEFEKKIRSLIMKTVNLTKELLAECAPQKPEYIIITGGSSEMPMVEKTLRKQLPEYAEKIIKYRPAMAVAAGAARYGSHEHERATAESYAADSAKPSSHYADASTSSKSSALADENTSKQSDIKKGDTAEEQYELAKKYYYGTGVAQNYAKAAEYYLKAAESGHIWAQRALGYCYQFGNGVAQSYQKAFEWYSKAAAQGHAQSQGDIGFLYEKGYYVTQSYNKAVEWYTKSAENGNAWSQRQLGYCYQYGNGVAQSYQKAFEWFTKAAEQGNITAQGDIGFFYEKGYHVAQNYGKALEWYKKAAENGHAWSQRQLAYCYQFGNGVAQNYQKAFEWYNKAAEQGHAQAQGDVGFFYEKGYHVTQNYEKAFEWYKKAAENGNAWSQCKLGYCYGNGKGVEMSNEKAFEWYTKSALQNDVTAQYNLALYYENGYGTAQNYQKAIEWYEKAKSGGDTDAQAAIDRIKAKLAQQTEEKKAKEAEAQFDLGEKYYYGRGGFVTNYTQAANHYRKAAENGHVKAQVEIGRCYENGRGVLKDPALAVSWITKAAEKGNADAQASLGYYYDTGFGVTQNYYKAVEWYTKAALQNNKTAQYNLAICYEYGRGVIADKYKAIEWYNKAAAQGHAKARDAAARLSAPTTKSAPAATAATYEKKPGFFARSFFFMFSLVALIPLLFVFDNGKVWAALCSITPLGLAKQTGIPNFSYSMTVFTVCTVIVYLISLLFIKYILHEHDKVPFNNHLLNVIACIGIWYAGYGISHLLVKITWGYRFFALIIAIVASFALAIAHFFLQSALDINLHYSKDVTSYNNKLCLVNLKYIVSLAFFHIGMTIVLAYENGIGHEDTFWNNFTLTALLIGGAVFSLFYAIKRITVVCEKGMMSYRKREKIRNEIIFIVITLAAAAALFFFLGVPGINVENKALEICLFPALITIPFVLIFRIISIISIKARN